MLDEVLTSRWRRSAIAASASVVLLTGCATPPSSSLDAVSDLDVLLMRPVGLDDALTYRVAECLLKAGFDGGLYVGLRLHLADAHGSDYLGETLRYSGLLPTLTSGAASSTGYRSVLRPRVSLEDDQHALPADIESASVDFGGEHVEVDIPGVGTVSAPAEGCYPESAAALFGSVEEWLLADQFAIAGIGQFGSAALESEQVVTIAADYSECMAVSGFDAGNPAQAAQLARDSWVPAGQEDEKVTADEIEMAVADAACQREFDVLGLAERKTVELAEFWIADNADTISRAAAAQRRALVAAGY